MPDNRFFTDVIFSPHQKIKIENEEFHHLKVMRPKNADSIELVNGKNELAEAIILELAPKHALVEIKSVFKSEKPKNRLILAQALPRLNRLDNIIEKTTELGITDLWLFPSDHSEKTALSTNQFNRLRTITISAMKQSGTLWLPTISYYDSLASCLFIKKECFFGDVRPNASPLIKELPVLKNIENDICFFTGPEKGFTKEEIFFLENSIKAKGVSLSRQILRTDTAAIAAIVLLHQILFLQ